AIAAARETGDFRRRRSAGSGSGGLLLSACSRSRERFANRGGPAGPTAVGKTPLRCQFDSGRFRRVREVFPSACTSIADWNHNRRLSSGWSPYQELLFVLQGTPEQSHMDLCPHGTISKRKVIAP